PCAWALLVPHTSKLPDKTARLYAGLGSTDFGDGSRAEYVAHLLRRRIAPSADLLVNTIEPAARRLHPGLAALQRRLDDSTGLRFLVAGAGPSLFALSGDRAAALRALPTVRRVAPEALAVRLV